MIFVINAENRRLFEADLVQMYRQRKAVAVEGTGWAIPIMEDLEMDSYDREDTIYLLAKDRPDGQVLASVRLLTTTGPHLMCKLFDALAREKIPRGTTVWEASRFSAAPGIEGRDRRHGLLWELICGVLETGLLYGIDEVIFAASRALLPLALNCGWAARTLGPDLRYGRNQVTSAAAVITPTGLREMRQRHGTPVPVTRIHAMAPLTLDAIEGRPRFGRLRAHPTPSEWRHRWQENRPPPGKFRHD